MKANLDTMCDVLLILNKKYSDNLRIWFHELVTVQNIILPNVTENMKSTFFKRVLKLVNYYHIYEYQYLLYT